MRQCVLIGHKLTNDSVFMTNTTANRDGCNEPYNLLASYLLERGFAIHTKDRLTTAPAFELHIDVHRPISAAPQYLLQIETPAIWPANGRELRTAYRKVFTWRDDLVDGSRFMKIQLSNPISIPSVDGFAERPNFCCLIAGNKAVRQSDPRELYSERIQAIRWFEGNSPADFSLFGQDWTLPAQRPGLTGRLWKRVQRFHSRISGQRPFPSYRGPITSKREVLEKYKYSICYENVRDMPGYVTEKIFDCFMAGCVPVYWGASNVDKYIPPETFIDRRNFKTFTNLYQYMKSVKEGEFVGFQKAMVAFLKSDAAVPFSSSFFARTICDAILSDLENVG